MVKKTGTAAKVKSSTKAKAGTKTASKQSGGSAGKVKELQEKLDDWTENGLFEAQNLMSFLRFNAKFTKYSYINRALIFRSMPTATSVATYKAWNGLGRNVKKGEHGIQIFCPNIRKKPQDPEDEYEHDSDGNRIKNADGTDRKKSTWAGYHLATVFDQSQTEGEPVPDVLADSEDAMFETEGDLCAALRKYAPLLTESKAESMFRDTAKQALKSTEDDTDSWEEKTEAVAIVLASYCSMELSFDIEKIKSWASGRKAKEIKAFMNTVIKASAAVIKAIDGDS